MASRKGSLTKTVIAAFASARGLKGIEMTKRDVQKRLADIGHYTGAIDGAFGPMSKAALLAACTNTNAPAINHNNYVAAASRLGCSVAQIKAFAEVESGKSSYTREGRPVILFERHKFRSHTKGRFDRVAPSISHPKWGGYGASSRQYDRLVKAAGYSPSAALKSASWGKFQVLGENAGALGYPDVLSFVLEMVESEGNHLDSFVRFIEANGLAGKLRSCRANDADSCRAVVRRYNGPAYAKNNYHVKLAKAIARHS